jgi:hypothetical protein
MKRAVVGLLGLVALLGGAAPVAGQVIQLKSGETLVGKILDAPHEDGLTFQRLDTGGVLDLRWEHLSVESAGRIRAMAGLSTDDLSEVTVPAVAIRYEIGGGGMDRIVGRIVGESDSQITVRRLGVDFPIQRSAIKEHRTVEVPAREVYSPSEFYSEKLAELAPGDDADKHILLGDLMMRVGDFEHAALHYDSAAKLGGGKQKNTLEGKIKRLERFKTAAAESLELEKIRTLLARRDFEKGVAAIEAFKEKFPAGKLQDEFARLQRRFEKARQQHLVDQVVSMWYRTIAALARSKAGEASLGFEAARAYAEEQMGQDIRSRVQKALDLAPEVVEEMWAARLEERSAPRPERYHYGLGSWTLGAETITKNTTQAKAESEEEKSDADQRMERLVKRIKEAQERARRAQAQQSGRGEQEDTPEQWWEDASIDERTQWLRAYYAEHGGDLVVKAAFLDGCLTCGATGRLTIYGQSGEAEQAKCPTCRGTRFKRWVRAQ